MSYSKKSIFSSGAFVGGIMCYLVIVVLVSEKNGSGLTAYSKQSIDWIDVNLGNSIYAFLSVFLLFCIEVHKFKKAFCQGCHKDQWNNPNRVSQLISIQQRATVWANVFITIGVLATAWGMRDALLYALGDLDSQNAIRLGAFGILERLVNGGVLLALTTTVVGGLGGYAMRIVILILISQPIQKVLRQQAYRDQTKLLEHLASIDFSASACSVSLHGKEKKGIE